MRAKKVYENIEFERGRDPKRSMDVGITVENRDPNKMRKNFERDFPMFRGHTGELHGAAGDWTTYTAEARNPKDGKKIMDRKGEILDWFKTHTDYDVVKLESAFDRKFHLWGDPKQPLEWNQQFTVHLGYNDNIKESVNFERGKDPKEVLRIGLRGRNSWNLNPTPHVPALKWLDSLSSPHKHSPKEEENIKEAIEIAAKLLNVSPDKVLLDIEPLDDWDEEFDEFEDYLKSSKYFGKNMIYRGENWDIPITDDVEYSYMDDNIIKKEKMKNGLWELHLGESGIVYIIHPEYNDPWAMMGTIY